MSKNALRIRGIPAEVEEKVIWQRIYECISTHRPQLRKRILSSDHARGQGHQSIQGLSLTSQSQEQVATVSLESADIKKHILDQHASLEGWRLDDHFLGLTVLHAPRNHEADICAIHGLGGNAFDTWAASSTMWLRDLLPSSTPFDRCRISTFGYSSSLRDRSAYAGIRQWAVDFLNQVSHIRSSEENQQKPLIIVCHSLGGLVGREVLIRLGSFPNKHPHIRLGQCGILFLATPHSGTTEADWSEMLLAIFEQAYGERNRDLVANLKSFNENSVASKERFAALSPMPPFCCLSEGKKMKIAGSYRLIVSQDSAGLNDVAAESLSEANHSSICKYDGRTGEYLTVLYKLTILKSTLQERLSGIARQPRAPSTPFKPQEAQLDPSNKTEQRPSIEKQHDDPSPPPQVNFGAVTSSDQSKVAQINVVNTSNFTM